MFSKSNTNMTHSNEKSSGVVNAIGKGSTITGEIRTNGDLRVDGTLKGNVYTKGLLVLGETGVIEGEVVCQNALISGAELLSLRAKANLLGDIVTNKLSIEPGANFTGSCSMGASVKNIKLSETNEKPKEKTA